MEIGGQWDQHEFISNALGSAGWGVGGVWNMVPLQGTCGESACSSDARPAGLDVSRYHERCCLRKGDGPLEAQGPPWVKSKKEPEQDNQTLAGQLQGDERGIQSGEWRDGVTERRALWKSSMGLT